MLDAPLDVSSLPPALLSSPLFEGLETPVLQRWLVIAERLTLRAHGSFLASRDGAPR